MNIPSSPGSTPTTLTPGPAPELVPAAIVPVLVPAATLPAAAAPPAAATPQPTTPPVLDTSATHLTALRAALTTATTYLAAANAALAPYYVSVSAVQRKHMTPYTAARMAYIPAIITLVRTRPDVAPGGTDADEMDTEVAIITAAQQYVTTLHGMLQFADDTARAQFGGLWNETREVYTLAKQRGRTDAALAAAVAPLADALRRTNARTKPKPAATGQPATTTTATPAHVGVVQADGSVAPVVVQPAPAAPPVAAVTPSK